jgi:N-sulfoglucosamine sulfohydrolase
MKNQFSLLFLIPVAFSSCGNNKAEDRPNILFIIADDISRNSMGAYGSEYIKTPNFDRIAEEGVLFTNAFVSNPKCAPARACLLTGRYSWQLEEACNHWALMPEKWVFYPDILEDSGYFMGFTGKGWSPGVYSSEHNPAGWEYNEIKLKPPYKSISNKDYCANFEAFLAKNDEDKPFCFWLGTHEAHRSFERDSYIKENMDLDKVNVQECMPDNELVRADLADYGVEVQYHDKQIGRCLEILEEKGLLENTLIIVTSDHGMAFPHIKGQIYDEGFRVAFAARWENRIEPGRTVDDFINFPDVAPTIMEAVGLKPHEQMTGKSFLNLLESKKSGKIDDTRSFALLGKERHDVGRTDGDQITVGYPVRAIRTDRYLYARNFKANRWPVGDPEYNYLNCDDSPTKTYLIKLSQESPDYKFFDLSFGKRPEEELYDINKDPDCIVNLADDPEYLEIKSGLSQKMEAELIKQNDPRILGNGDIFDYYPHGNIPKLKSLYGDKYKDMQKIFEAKYPETNK